MADNSYRVMPRGNTGFDVEMDKPDGRKTTVPGFRSEHEADAWIIQTKRMIRDASPWTPLAPRKPATKAPEKAPGNPSPPQQIEQPRVQRTHKAVAARDARVSVTRKR